MTTSSFTNPTAEAAQAAQVIRNAAASLVKQVITSAMQTGEVTEEDIKDLEIAFAAAERLGYTRALADHAALGTRATAPAPATVN